MPAAIAAPDVAPAAGEAGTDPAQGRPADRARSPAAGWMSDPQVLLAAAAAVPVWLALGRLAGPGWTGPSDATAWLSLIVLSPWVEELVFRGLLQPWLLRLTGWRRLGPLTWANLLTSAVFAAMHLPNAAAVWALSTVVPSLVFGHLRERFGSVWPAVALHAFYNAGLGLVLFA